MRANERKGLEQYTFNLVYLMFIYLKILKFFHMRLSKIISLYKVL